MAKTKCGPYRFQLDVCGPSRKSVWLVRKRAWLEVDPQGGQATFFPKISFLCPALSYHIAKTASCLLCLGGEPPLGQGWGSVEDACLAHSCLQTQNNKKPYFSYPDIPCCSRALKTLATLAGGGGACHVGL